MALYDTIEEGITSVIAAYKEAKADDNKVSFSEIVAIGSKAIGSFVVIAESFSGLSSEEKKNAVVSAVGQLYDEVLAPYDIEKIPNFIEPILDKGIKQLLLALSDGIIDAIVALYNENGWPDNNTPDDNTPDDAE
jgi:hypothetical protein|tara:strand:- start:283 stop:687 length:405 start_codon:yes stop_codon:yes gene_type:complete